MSTFPEVRKRLPVLLIGVTFLAGGTALFLNWLRAPSTNPVSRGWNIAQEAGCFGCHGLAGSGGIADPFSIEGEVPAWDGGMLTMYVESEEEIREWILFGRPLRHSHTEGNATSEDREERSQLFMPAYGAVLDDSEVNDLVALVKAIGAYQQPPLTEEARRGMNVASSLGCFGCHRLGGRVGLRNQGSFKGYIPPWVGNDFQELVRNDTELREWILEGSSQRLRRNPIAEFFLKRQIIKMPAYKGLIDEEGLASVQAYIKWLPATTSAESLP